MIVWLPHLFKRCITCARNNLPTPKRKTKPEKHTPKQRESKQTETNHHQNSERRRRRKKKKQVREPDLGEEVEQGVRVEVVVLGREEETQGESQTPEKGFGFPQHLRKKEKEKTAPTKQPNTKRERGDTKHLGIQGSGLEGRQTKHHSNPKD